MSRVALLAIVLAFGCGGSKKNAAGAGAPRGDGDGDCEPGRCMEDISARVNERRPAARACYEAGHAHDPTLKGRLVINFEIGPDGTVVDASQGAQDDQIMDASVIDCVVDIIRQIEFAKSALGKTTRAFHSYEFSPP